MRWAVPGLSLQQRHFRRPNETIIPVPDETGHIDTNCLFMLKGSFFVTPHFAMMPKEISAIGDRVFARALQERALRAAIVPLKTVNYHCMWENIYRAIGEAPPPGAKPSVDGGAVNKYLRGLSDREFKLVSNLSGVRFSR